MSPKGPQETGDPELLQIGKEKNILWGFTSLTECGDDHGWKQVSVQISLVAALLLSFKMLSHNAVCSLWRNTFRSWPHPDTLGDFLPLSENILRRQSEQTALDDSGTWGQFLLKNRPPVCHTPLLQRTAPLWWSGFTFGDSGPYCDQMSLACAVCFLPLWLGWRVCRPREREYTNHGARFHNV